jgi:hypothetical protein
VAVGAAAAGVNNAGEVQEELRIVKEKSVHVHLEHCCGQSKCHAHVRG